MNTEIKQNLPKDRRKEFRAPEQELLRLESHCTNNHINQSAFIRAAIIEKIQRDQNPLQTSDCFQENQFYNFVQRRSVTSPAVRKILTEFEKELQEYEKEFNCSL